MKKEELKKGKIRRKHETAILEAIKDINNEVKALRKIKSNIELTSKNIKESLISTQNKESKLREKISLLIKKEDKIEKKRTNVKEKLERIKDKIDKVIKIKEELSEIE